MRIVITVLIFCYSTISLSQILYADNENQYDSLLFTNLIPDTNKTRTVIKVQKTKYKDTVIIDRKVGTIKFISHIKLNSKIIYDVYLHEYDAFYFKVFKKDTLEKIHDKFRLNPYCIVLIDSTGRFAAYTYHVQKGQFYKVENEAILKFRDTKDTTVTVEINPISNDNQKSAYNKDRSVMLFVLLNFVNKNGKVVLPRDR